MSKYRFKTKEEFIHEDLWDNTYNTPYGWNFRGGMNMYLGTNVPEEFDMDCVKNKGFKYNDWVFSKNDYVLKEQQEYFDNKSTHIDFTSNIEPLKDLSEIQKYLPNEHPDKITSSEFKKGEYIVLIGNGQSKTGSSTVQTDSYIQNHCYKVRESNVFLRSELDSCGSTTNGWKCIPYNPNKFHKTRNWRYATQEEINEYERRGKPYDVTELHKKELSMKEIQEECKKRFPIGCTYIDTDGDKHVLKEDSYTYEIRLNKIFAHGGAGCLYKNGKWAKLVSSSKQNDLKEEVIKYSEETNATILLASNIKSKELHSTYEETLLSVKLLSNKTTHLINNVSVLSSVNLKIK